MLRRLIEFALSQRLLMLLAVLGIAVAGTWAFLRLPIDAYPNIAPTQVKLILKAPGMTPEEVETRVVTPLELELLGIPDSLILRSTAKYAIADITLDFKDGTDIYWARQQVAERFAAAAGSLPARHQRWPGADRHAAVGHVHVHHRGRRPEPGRAPHPAGLDHPPGAAHHSRASPTSTRSAARCTATWWCPTGRGCPPSGLHFRDVVDAVQRNNRNDGAGRLREGDDALIVRAEGAIQSLDDLRQVVVSSRDGIPVRVGDVADVRYGSLTRYGAVTRDGQGEAVEGLVVGLRGADAQSVVSQVEAKLASLQSSFPAGTRLEVFYNRSALIERAVGTVKEALIEATVLVVILLLLFLGDVRAALVVSLTLPMAALITFLLMQLFGMSANLMSLGGLAIAIGMLVDAAVVVVENTVSRLEPDSEAATLPRLHRIYRAVVEVATPVTAGIVIICLVFMPLLTLQGLEGKLFAPVALTIVFALAASLLLSLTVIPVLCSFLLRERAHHEPWLMRQLDRGYRPLLDWSLAHGKWMGVAAGVALLLGVLAYMGTGKTFMPTMDEGDMLVQLVKQPSISLEASRDQDMAIERAIKAHLPEVEHVVARLGSDELGLDPMGLNETDMFLQLKPKSTWREPSKAWLEDELRARDEEFPGRGVRLYPADPDARVGDAHRQPRRHRGEGVRHRSGHAQPAGQPDCRHSGKDHRQPGRDRADPGGRALPQRADRSPGRRSLRPGRVGGAGRAARAAGRPACRHGDRAAAAHAGTGSRTTATLRETPSRFERLSVARGDAGEVPLDQLATIEPTTGPVQVRRENGSRFALVQANVSGRDLVGFVEEARAEVQKQIHLPAGYSVTWGGQFENQQRAAARLAIVVPVALGLIFLVLFSTFGSVRQAALILCNVPFALVGGIVTLWLTGQYLSVPASVGFIALLGIAVLNGLVLVSHFNQLRASGLSAGRRGARGRAAAPAPGDDDRLDYRPWPGAAAVRQRPRLRGAAPAGDRGDRWPGQLHRADPAVVARAVSPLRRGLRRTHDTHSEAADHGRPQRTGRRPGRYVAGYAARLARIHHQPGRRPRREL